jgi:hypothetical protein
LNLPLLWREGTFNNGQSNTSQKPVDISMAMRVISGMVLALILEHIMGDKTLEAKWAELPDFLTDMILDDTLE